MNHIEDNIYFEIEHDLKYKIGVGVNSGKADAEFDLFIPMKLPIRSDEIPAELYGVLRTIFGLMLASIVVSRLGVPQREDKVIINIDGLLPSGTKDDLETILRNFMVSRSILAKHISPGDVELEINADYISLDEKFRTGNEDNNVLLAFSGGIDSTAILHLYRNKGINVTPVFVKYESDEQKSDVQRDRLSSEKILKYMKMSEESIDVDVFFDEIKRAIPWQTRMYKEWYFEYQNVQDRDDWDYYGRNAVLASILLLLSIPKRAKYIALGHTREGLFSTYKNNGMSFYDRCCASIYFVSLFNRILDRIFGADEVALIAPLMNMDKISTTKYLLEDTNLFSLTHSCICPDEIEDGICFSCFDRMTGILSSVPPDKLRIIKSEEEFQVFVNSQKISSFQWFPDHRNSGIWGKQLLRYCNGYKENKSNILNGIYNPMRIISTCRNLQGNQALREFLPLEFDQFEAGKEEVCGERKDPIALSPLMPSDCVREYKECFDNQLLVTHARNIQPVFFMGV